MKVRLLPLAITTAIAMPGVALAEGPTLYGKMNVTYEMVTDEISGDLITDTDDDAWQLNSNASRIGVKGSEAITDNLNAIYQAEFGINVDDGSGPFSQRDIFAGLQGGWGTFKVGKYDTPLKKSQGKVDQFNDMQFGDLNYLMEGENREGDLLQYSSPAIADAITVNVAFQPGEGANDNDGPADNFSISLVYSSEMFYGAIAMDDGMGDVTDINDVFVSTVDATRITGMLMLGAFEVGAIYQMAEASESADFLDETSFVVSGGFKLGDSGKLRAQFAMVEDDAVDGEGTQFAFGYDHKLSKQTKLFANYIFLDSEFGDGAIDVEQSTLMVGMDHKF